MESQKRFCFALTYRFVLVLLIFADNFDDDFSFLCHSLWPLRSVIILWCATVSKRESPPQIGSGDLIYDFIFVPF